jgi:hypothetical protein
MGWLLSTPGSFLTGLLREFDLVSTNWTELVVLT